ncbi:Fascin-like incomplete domain containing protein [Pandoravirus quercus]|uniref:Fascin-like incomplete domain containing protein n=1 Tax=Pandoravirus quercus TaxID=2107709 RepID=A0A2U7U828_9VIRU|nr:Fascin-like incomplete domain containing protein [Pandoravirus quercus]AVK74552.1 Fascin-like incomplete domain containing protein [Pandoravirus quercus]
MARSVLITPMTITSVALVVLLCWAAVATDAYRYALVIDTSSTATLPVGATDVRVTLWGGGGGGASTHYCGAGGGSGATILNRTVDTAAWGVAIETVQWTATVGQGGVGSSGFYVAGYGGDGGETALVARGPGGAQLFAATAYGGGGAVALPDPDRRGCTGGAGGGQASSASGVVPGSGVPPGAADNNNASAPAEGAMVGDVKAGGAGAGHGFVLNNINNSFVDGAGWTVVGRTFAGGAGIRDECRAWGGAAGFGGVGGSGRGHSRICASPPPNSGAGGGSAYVCVPTKQYADSRGADGGVIIEYEYPVAPSPSSTASRTPSRTPSPSATRSITPSSTPAPSKSPSNTPSPTPQPIVQLITLVSPISGKQLTPQEDGSVASLWYGASYKEKWQVVRTTTGKYVFRGFNGRYLGANPGGWVRAEATTYGSWEQWDVLINAGNQWTLKSVHGTYMGTTTAGVVYLNDNASLYWTKTNV